MRTDFDAIADGARLTLHPNTNNALHKRPVKATYASGYFYCDGTNPAEGPDYCLGDVLRFNDGYTPEPDHG